MTDEMPKEIYVMRIRDEYIALDKINDGTIDDMSTKYIRADTINEADKG